jgi:hypothetical protein
VNIQPVIPIDLNADWLMISRTILPVIHQDEIFPDAGSQAGFGDITQSLFFSPKTGSRLTWGVGPALLLPTATHDLLGTGKWGAGPDRRRALPEWTLDCRRTREPHLVLRR